MNPLIAIFKEKYLIRDLIRVLQIVKVKLNFFLY